MAQFWKSKLLVIHNHRAIRNQLHQPTAPSPGACRRDYFPPVIFSAVFVPLWVGSIVFDGIKEIRGWICKSEIVSAYGNRANPTTSDAPVLKSESIRTAPRHASGSCHFISWSVFFETAHQIPMIIINWVTYPLKGNDVKKYINTKLKFFQNWCISSWKSPRWMLLVYYAHLFTLHREPSTTRELSGNCKLC